MSDNDQDDFDSQPQPGCPDAGMIMLAWMAIVLLAFTVGCIVGAAIS
jgi:hypothetical protein